MQYEARVNMTGVDNIEGVENPEVSDQKHDLALRFHDLPENKQDFPIKILDVQNEKINVESIDDDCFDYQEIDEGQGHILRFKEGWLENMQITAGKDKLTGDKVYKYYDGYILKINDQYFEFQGSRMKQVDPDNIVKSEMNQDFEVRSKDINRTDPYSIVVDKSKIAENEIPISAYTYIIDTLSGAPKDIEFDVGYIYGNKEAGYHKIRDTMTVKMDKKVFILE